MTGDVLTISKAILGTLNRYFILKQFMKMRLKHIQSKIYLTYFHLFCWAAWISLLSL